LASTQQHTGFAVWELHADNNPDTLKERQDPNSTMPGVERYIGAEMARGGDKDATQNRATRLEGERM